MNPTILTAIIASASFILAVFGASWLNQQAMNKRIDDLKTYLDARFDTVNARFDAVDARFKAVDERFAHIESRLDRIERQLDQVFKPVLPH
jgi:flagellar capping protein FliD